MIVVLRKIFIDKMIFDRDFGAVALFFCQGKNMTGDVSKQNSAY